MAGAHDVQTNRTREKLPMSGMIRCDNLGPRNRMTHSILALALSVDRQVPRRTTVGEAAGPSAPKYSLAHRTHLQQPRETPATPPRSCDSVSTLPAGTPGGTTMSISLPSGMRCWNETPGPAQSGTLTEKLFAEGPPLACATQLHPPVSGFWVSTRTSPGSTPWEGPDPGGGSTRQPISGRRSGHAVGCGAAILPATSWTPEASRTPASFWAVAHR